MLWWLRGRTEGAVDRVWGQERAERVRAGPPLRPGEPPLVWLQGTQPPGASGSICVFMRMQKGGSRGTGLGAIPRLLGPEHSADIQPRRTSWWQIGFGWWAVFISWWGDIYGAWPLGVKIRVTFSKAGVLSEGPLGLSALALLTLWARSFHSGVVVVVLLPPVHGSMLSSALLHLTLLYSQTCLQTLPSISSPEGSSPSVSLWVWVKGTEKLTWRLSPATPGCRWALGHHVLPLLPPRTAFWYSCGPRGAYPGPWGGARSAVDAICALDSDGAGALAALNGVWFHYLRLKGHVFFFCALFLFPPFFFSFLMQYTGEACGTFFFFGASSFIFLLQLQNQLVFVVSDTNIYWLPWDFAESNSKIVCCKASHLFFQLIWFGWTS